MLATRNAHKLREFAAPAARHELEPLPDEVELPPETGETFADNALIKARAAARGHRPRRRSPTTPGIEAAALGGAPGVRSARYAGEHATDEENLDKLLREAPAGSRAALRVRARLRRPATARSTLFEGRCDGHAGRRRRAASGGFGYDPVVRPRRRSTTAARWPSSPTPRRTRSATAAARARRAAGDGSAGPLAPPDRAAATAARRGAGRAASPRGRALDRLEQRADPAQGRRRRDHRLGGDPHRGDALEHRPVASIVAFFSVRKADEPADEDHRYGHEKIENLAAAIEGMLILVGSGVIVFEAIRRLVDGAQVQRLGFGIAVDRRLARSPTSPSRPDLSPPRARRPTRRRSRATRRTCAPTRSPRSACSSASCSCRSPGPTGSTRSSRSSSPCAIVVTGRAASSARSSRVLVDEALPDDEHGRSARRSPAFGAARRRRLPPAAHAPRRRPALRRPARAVPRRHHARGGARASRTSCRTRSSARVRGADVLIHLEPEDRVRPGEELGPGRSEQVDGRRDAPTASATPA